MNILLPLLLFGLAFLALFGIAELLYRVFKVHAEYTRKFVHIGTGLLTLLFPLVLDHFWQVAILCISFLILLLLSLRFGWFPSINAVKRKTAGSWLFAVIVIFAFLFYERVQLRPDAFFEPRYYFYTPLLILAFCDPIAALAGSRWKDFKGIEGPQKTVAGSLAFALLAFGVTLFLGQFFRNPGTSLSVLIIGSTVTAVVTALAERVTDDGWDNFTVPAVAMLSVLAVEAFL